MNGIDSRVKPYRALLRTRRGIGLIELLTAIAIAILVAYPIFSVVSTGINASLHISMQSELVSTAQDMMAKRGYLQTLGSVPLPGTGNSLACTPGQSCANPYTLADLTTNCVSSVNILGTKSPSHFPTTRPGNLPFTLILTDLTQKPIGKLNPTLNSTQVGNFTFMTGCVIVGDSNPVGYKPCLTIQGAMVQVLNTANVYGGSSFRIDPLSKQPFTWTAAYALPDCGSTGLRVTSPH